MKTDFELTGKLYRKIDLWVLLHTEEWRYHSTTQQWKTCRAAKQSLAHKLNLPLNAIRANFVASK